MLDTLKMPSYAKTTGSRGVHIYIPIERGPVQKDVWTFAKAIALEMEAAYPKIATAEYRKAKRPHGTVNVDYNQNAWGRTLSSIYSVRPTPKAAVSTPVSWEELEDGVQLDEFRIDNVVERVSEIGDLWKPVLAKKRFDLDSVFRAPKKKSPRPRAKKTQ
jgi:bifunctional non-homologous end joining protein LigD